MCNPLMFRLGYMHGPMYYHCCCGPTFLSAEEELKMLDEYKQRLQKEIEGIDRRIAEVKKKK